VPYKDPEEYREYQRRYRERNRDRLREYRRKTSERRRVARRRHYVENADHARALARRWAAENPDRRRANEANRKARKLDQFIEDVDPRTVYAMHGGMCGICEQYIDGDFHVDHIIPLSKGGMHGYINVQPAHPICNRRKGDRV
jgi:5-methylcytosine-specific restriction endonuclease McrA